MASNISQRSSKSQQTVVHKVNLANKAWCSFQQVEGISALQSSIRFLPHVVMGIAANIVTAYLVARVKIQYLAVVSALITMIAPPLMATVEIDENYWFAPFWALFLSPVNPDGT